MKISFRGKQIFTKQNNLYQWHLLPFQLFDCDFTVWLHFIQAILIYVENAEHMKLLFTYQLSFVSGLVAEQILLLPCMQMKLRGQASHSKLTSPVVLFYVSAQKTTKQNKIQSNV